MRKIYTEREYSVVIFPFLQEKWPDEIFVFGFFTKNNFGHIFAPLILVW
jgi:hypothetical protein